MKTLKHHTLIYDQDCPLCVAYTEGFIKSGMLDNEGRYPFQKIDEFKQSNLNTKRAVNEIALVDKQTQKVTYGLASLLKIIGTSFPMVERVGNQPIINYLLKKLYSFVSYNRKVIVSKKQNSTIANQCEPAFNYKYRLLYIAFAAITSAYILTAFVAALPMVQLTTNFGFELLAVLLQIPFQLVFLQEKDTKIMLNYTGHLITVSLIGALLLPPILFINYVFALPVHILLTTFLMVVAFMIFLHKKRVDNLNLPPRLTISWILYRLLLGTLILL